MKVFYKIDYYFRLVFFSIFFLILGSDNHDFKAYIDPENKFDIHDKFSQINVLEQLKNLRTYKFLGDKINKGLIQSHALWVCMV